MRNGVSSLSAFSKLPVQQDGSSYIISATGTCSTFLEIFHNKSLVKKWSSFCPPRCWRALNLNLKIEDCINSVIMKVSFRPGYSSFTPPCHQFHPSGHSQHCSEKFTCGHLNYDSLFYKHLIHGGFIFVKHNQLETFQVCARWAILIEMNPHHL